MQKDVLQRKLPAVGMQQRQICLCQRKEHVRAQIRVLVKRILRKHGYPPDKQEKATATVLEQAALLSAEWAAA